MIARIGRALVWLGGLGLLCGWGCSGAPQAPPRQHVNATAAAKAAIAQYDTNGDGKLDAQELEQSPPLAAMLATVKHHDPSHGDWLTAEDIAGRIKSWLQADTIITSGDVVVLLDGKPLAGATVTLEPEPWLGPSYRTSTGTTKASGYASMSRTLEAYTGIYLGLYRVKISKKVDGRETVPQRYNDKTVLGREVADDVPDAESVLGFKLQSK
jgi:hypothetical protein